MLHVSTIQNIIERCIMLHNRVTLILPFWSETAT